MRNRIRLTAFGVAVVALAIFALSNPAFPRDGMTSKIALDRIASAVDGVESGHGMNMLMWRTNREGPQGPMQVSEKAAIDVGGGDRFDVVQNRAIGRAYLALLYRRYGNWSDAISAYNWGMGNLDGWIKGGRQSQKLVPVVAMYLRRVLWDSGLCGLGASVADCRLEYKGLHLSGYSVSTSISQSDELLLPGLKDSGRPLAILATSGRPLPVIQQSGRLLPGLERSGRALPRLGRSVVCSSLDEVRTKPNTQRTFNPYSIFARTCH